jgi:poly(A)-specific ribonuclease
MRCAELDREEVAAREGAIRQAAGFAAVMDLMRKCGKPAVGHNLMFDLAYMLYG